MGALSVFLIVLGYIWVGVAVSVSWYIYDMVHGYSKDDSGYFCIFLLWPFFFVSVTFIGSCKFLGWAIARLTEGYIRRKKAELAEKEEREAEVKKALESLDRDLGKQPGKDKPACKPPKERKGKRIYNKKPDHSPAAPPPPPPPPQYGFPCGVWNPGAIPFSPFSGLPHEDSAKQSDAGTERTSGAYSDIPICPFLPMNGGVYFPYLAEKDKTDYKPPKGGTGARVWRSMIF